jgi:hypothetical protein
MIKKERKKTRKLAWKFEQGPRILTRIAIISLANIEKQASKQVKNPILKLLAT